MSSRRKNATALLLLAVAALLLAGGIRLAGGKGLMADEAAKEEETMMFSTAAYEESSVYATSAAVSVENETSPASAISVDTGALNGNETSSGSGLIRFAGIAAILAGAGVAAVVMLRLPQEAPLLGPDGAALALAIGVIFRLQEWNYLIGLALFLFLLLVMIRELAGWLRKRCCPGSLLTVRLAHALTNLAYGKDIRHFSRQLESFRSGEPVEVRDGLYADMEEKLRAIQKEHAEAIRAAVTSERFKVELITNVSHDLRTPLTTIIGCSELLQGEKLSEEGAASLALLGRKAGYMKDLVGDLFELSRISSGSVDPELQALDLISLLEQTIGLMQHELDEAGLSVKRQYGADRIQLVTDGSRMHQVFANLLENAAKYALKGSRIYVWAEEEETGVRIRIVNTASYEMDFTAEEIVQRFARGDKARSTEGSGLGLAIAQTYTESVGGRFEVEIDGDQFGAVVRLPRG